MSTAIVDYGMGNVRSVANMLRRVDTEPIIVNRPGELLTADRAILPGVGSFDNCVTRLQELGFADALRVFVSQRERPVLGICLGMQMLGSRSEEGAKLGFGWLDFDVVHLSKLVSSERLAVPHMGWNELAIVRPDPLVAGLEVNSRFYFAHSYAVPWNDASWAVGTTEYGCRLTACVRERNIMGVQFHPEKSHRFGQRLLENFLRL